MLATGVARCGPVCACTGVRVASIDARLVARPGMQRGSGWYAVVPTHPCGLKQALLAPKLQCVMVQTVAGRVGGALWRIRRCSLVGVHHSWWAGRKARRAGECSRA